MKTKTVNVFGAGLVGSLISLMLAQKGHTIRLFERRPDMRKAEYQGGRSINLALSERGWKALEKVGLDSAIREIALPMEGRMIHMPDQEPEFQAYGKSGQAIYSVSRAGLNQLILDTLDQHEKVTSYYEHRLKWLYTETNKAEIEYVPTGKTMNFESDFTLGADGAFSATRLCMQMKSGFSYSQDYLPHGYKELTMPAVDGEFAMAPNALHIWPRQEFMLIALPNPDKTFTCTLFMPYKGEQGFDKLQEASDIESFMNSYFKDAVALMPNYLEEFQANPVGSLVTIACHPWNWDRTLLIGDASHAIVPFYGQGMNAGFEDCSILSELLENEDDWEAAFDSFQTNRKPDTDAIAALALNNYIEMRDRVADERFQLQKRIEKNLAKHFPEEWNTLYSMVSFSHAPYSKALQEGKFHDAFFGEVVFTEKGLEEKADNYEDLARWLSLYKEWLAEK